MVEADPLSLVLELGSKPSLCYILALNIGNGRVAGHTVGWNWVRISIPGATEPIHVKG